MPAGSGGPHGERHRTLLRSPEWVTRRITGYAFLLPAAHQLTFELDLRTHNGDQWSRHQPGADPDLRCCGGYAGSAADDQPDEDRGARLTLLDLRSLADRDPPVANNA